MKVIEQKYKVSKEYYRAKEASLYLGIGISTIWLYAKQGKLTPKKLSPRVTVFSKTELDSLFNCAEVA